MQGSLCLRCLSAKHSFDLHEKYWTFSWTMFMCQEFVSASLWCGNVDATRYPSVRMTLPLPFPGPLPYTILVLGQLPPLPLPLLMLFPFLLLSPCPRICPLLACAVAVALLLMFMVGFPCVCGRVGPVGPWPALCSISEAIADIFTRCTKVRSLICRNCRNNL